MNRQEKLQAIANYLEVDPSYFEEESYDPNIFESKEYNESYVVLTEEEAREYAKRDIESVFDDLGLMSFTKSFQDWILKNAVDIEAFAEEYFHDGTTADDIDLIDLRDSYGKDGRGNYVVYADIEPYVDMEKIVEECIRLDGIAHFIAMYDGKEIDLGNGLYAYRVN